MKHYICEEESTISRVREQNREKEGSVKCPQCQSVDIRIKKLSTGKRWATCIKCSHSWEIGSTKKKKLKENDNENKKTSLT